MFDILITPATTLRGRKLLRALADKAPDNTRVFESGNPRPGSVLMLYGLGGPDRYALGLNHVDNGNTLLCWDVGYWNRTGDDMARNFRLSINGLHPPQYVMRGECPSGERWGGMPIMKRGDPNGPVVLVGNGPKSNVIGAAGWAAAKSREIREAFPGKQIVYRPKPKRPMEPGVLYDRVDQHGPVEALLKEASLVVCRHSNVAVDACRLGVPVVCEDGAAAAIYPSRLEDKDNQPNRDKRKEFLHRLAWWQWSPNEAAEAWEWILQTLETASDEGSETSSAMIYRKP